MGFNSAFKGLKTLWQ